MLLKCINCLSTPKLNKFLETIPVQRARKNVAEQIAETIIEIEVSLSNATLNAESCSTMLLKISRNGFSGLPRVQVNYVIFKAP